MECHALCPHLAPVEAYDVDFAAAVRREIGQARYRVTSSEPLPPGKSTYDGDGLAKGGSVVMFVNEGSGRKSG
jgi:hypothetical protein